MKEVEDISLGKTAFGFECAEILDELFDARFMNRILRIEDFVDEARVLGGFSDTALLRKVAEDLIAPGFKKARIRG